MQINTLFENRLNLKNCLQRIITVASNETIKLSNDDDEVHSY